VGYCRDVPGQWEEKPPFRPHRRRWDGLASRQRNRPQTATAATTAAELSASRRGDAKIFVANEPTELIVTTGNPQFTQCLGDELLTQQQRSDLFLRQATIVLRAAVPRRWYAADT